MKKTILPLLLCILFFSSCKKFLETIPVDTIAPEGYFNTEAEAEIALAGVYDILGKSGTYGRTIFFELDVSDESFIALSTWTQDLGLLNYNPSDTKLTDLWIYLHVGISRANTVLANIGKVNMDAGKKAAIEGQALFLRSYYLFLLTNYWGNIPMRLAPVASVSDNDLAFTPYKDVYAQIVADMEKAADMVYPISKYAHAGRISKSVVWGVLARVNLKMAGAPLNDKSRYAEVKKWASKVIAEGHSLNPDYRDVFIRMCKGTYDTRETLWEVEFNMYNDGQNEEGSVGVINGISAAAEPWGYSYGAKHTTAAYFNMFENYTKTVNGVLETYSPDMRRDWSISSYYYSGALKANYNTSQIYNRMDAKWRREYDPSEPRFQGTSAINFPLLRFSDVLLMYAEADNEMTGPQTQAIEYVNQVRRRAYGKTLGEGVRYVNITNGGSGFTAEPEVTLVGGGGSGAEARAIIATTGANAGKITAVHVVNPGVGYTSAPTVVVAGTGTGATFTVEMTDRNTVAADLSGAQVADNVAFRTAIRKERALELGFEAMRRFDLVRWGDYYTTMKNVANNITTTAPAAYTYAARHGNNLSLRDTLLAIPSREIQMNRKAVQNKGW